MAFPCVVAARLAILLALALPIFAGSTPSSVTLKSSANPSVFGHAVTLTATVRPVTATGSVTFYEGTTVLETEPLTNGVAKFTTTLLASGTGSLKAYYGGDGTDAASSSAALMQMVNALPGYAFHPEVTYQSGPGPLSVAVGDFNGDGKQDLAFADNGVGDFLGGVSILLGNGDGTFQSAVNYPGLAPTSVATGDFNGDGKTDLVTANASSNVSVMLGNGDGTFQTAVNFATRNESLFVAVGDFNEDGKADLVIAFVTENEVSVMLGKGDGTFQPPVYYPVGSVSVALGDFNGDGKADLAVANYSIGSVSVLLGNGDGTFQSPVNYPAGGGPISVATGDLNGDGKADLAVVDQPGGVSVLLGNGDGTFQPATSYPTGGAPYSLAVGDFNGDAKADLVVADLYGDVSILLGNGDGTFQTPVNYLTGSGSAGVAVADLNGDGRADLAVADQNYAQILLAAPNPSSFTVLTSSPNPSTYNQKVTLTATISPNTATGTVWFYSNVGALGKIGVTDGKATLSTSTLPGGTDSLIAVFSGDATYPKSSSPTVTQTVNKAATFLGLTSSPNPSNLNQMVTFTATVSSATATGTVTFYHGSASLGTGTVHGGVATLAVSTLSAGAHAITAGYSGDGNYQASTSPPWRQTVK